MHIWIKIILQWMFAMVLFVGCKSSKAKKNHSNSDKNAPFVITKATYQNWHGEIQGEQVTIIVITGKNLKKDIVLKTLYYKGKKSNIIPKIKGKNLILKADINTSKRDRKFIMDGDSQKEYGNKPPVKNKYLNLKENEVILSFIEQNKEYVFLVKLTKKKDIFYPLISQ